MWRLKSKIEFENWYRRNIFHLLLTIFHNVKNNFWSLLTIFHNYKTFSLRFDYFSQLWTFFFFGDSLIINRENQYFLISPILQKFRNRKVRIKSQLRCEFLPLNQNWGSTNISTRAMTLIQSALDSSYPEVCFKYPEHYHNMRRKFSTRLWSQKLRKKKKVRTLRWKSGVRGESDDGSQKLTGLRFCAVQFVLCIFYLGDMQYDLLPRSQISETLAGGGGHLKTL